MASDPWTIDLPAVVTKNMSLAYKHGHAGHPCSTCGQLSRYEWSPAHHRACSAYCLSTQNPAQTVIVAVKERHGISLSIVKETPTNV